MSPGSKALLHITNPTNPHRNQIALIHVDHNEVQMVLGLFCRQKELRDEVSELVAAQENQRSQTRL